VTKATAAPTRTRDVVMEDAPFLEVWAAAALEDDELEAEAELAEGAAPALLRAALIS